MLRILNSNLAVLGTIPTVISAMFNVRFYDYGTFEIHLPTNCNFQNTFMIDNIIIYTYDDKKFYGIIEYIQKSDTEIILQGCDFKGLLKRRICQSKAEGYYTYADVFCARLIQDNLPTTGDRRLNLMSGNYTSLSSHITADTIEVDVSNTVDTVVLDICQKYEFGYDISVNSSNKLDVMMVAPTSTTTKLTRRFKTLGEVTYTDDTADYYNAFLPSTGYHNTGTKVIGISRREYYCETIAEAKEAIKEYTEQKSIECTTNQDLDVGDIVTVEFPLFGEMYSTSQIVTEIEYTYEANNITITPTMGNKKDSKIIKILKGRG